MITYQATAVMMHGRAVLIEGPPGSGKSSLALALIDRQAELIGDDGVVIEVVEGRLIVAPHPITRGLLEIRNLGLVPLPVCERAPVALVLRLDDEAPRFVEAAETVTIAGIALPMIRLCPASPVLHLRAEAALARYGLDLS